LNPSNSPLLPPRHVFAADYKPTPIKSGRLKLDEVGLVIETYNPLTNNHCIWFCFERNMEIRRQRGKFSCDIAQIKQLLKPKPYEDMDFIRLACKFTDSNYVILSPSSAEIWLVNDGPIDCYKITSMNNSQHCVTCELPQFDVAKLNTLEPIDATTLTIASDPDLTELRISETQIATVEAAIDKGAALPPDLENNEAAKSLATRANGAWFITAKRKQVLCSQICISKSIKLQRVHLCHRED